VIVIAVACGVRSVQHAEMHILTCFQEELSLLFGCCCAQMHLVSFARSKASSLNYSLNALK
jgi:hypothetical protein